MFEGQNGSSRPAHIQDTRYSTEVLPSTERFSALLFVPQQVNFQQNLSSFSPRRVCHIHLVSVSLTLLNASIFATEIIELCLLHPAASAGNSFCERRNLLVARPRTRLMTEIFSDVPGLCFALCFAAVEAPSYCSTVLVRRNLRPRSNKKTDEANPGEFDFNSSLVGNQGLPH